MAITTKTTKLEAVNEILSAVGETPVSSLSTQAGVQTVMAENMLDSMCRRVQAVGWSWNSREVTYVADASDNIAIPANIVRVDGGRSNKYVVRDGNLFDMVNNTDEFTSDILLKVVELLEWADLPQQCIDYLVAKTARQYSDRTLGSPEASRLTRQDEQETLARLVHFELSRGNFRVFGRRMGELIDERGFLRDITY